MIRIKDENFKIFIQIYVNINIKVIEYMVNLNLNLPFYKQHYVNFLYIISLPFFKYRDKFLQK